jgi:transcriptional regulator with XRE-family HTH domain
MTKARPFAELAAKVKANPVRRERIALEKKAIEDALSLAELRSQQNVTQQNMAKTLGVTQANISRIEHEEDLYLSTLRGYLAALGADLELNAVFPDGKFTLGAKEDWLGMTEAKAEAGHLALSGPMSVPTMVETHLRADRKLDPDQASLLARMFRAAYAELTEGESAHSEADSACPQEK